jgi:hypothetical protein
MGKCASCDVASPPHDEKAARLTFRVSVVRIFFTGVDIQV